MFMNVVVAFRALYLLIKKLEDEVVNAGEKSTREEDVALYHVSLDPEPKLAAHNLGGDWQCPVEPAS